MQHYVDIEIKNHISNRRYISRYYSGHAITSFMIHERIVRDIEAEVDQLINPVDMTQCTIEFTNELKCVDIFKDNKSWALLHTGAVIVYNLDKN